MGFFSIFKKDKGNENNEGNGNFLENYLNSKFKINTGGADVFLDTHTYPPSVF